MLNRFCFGTFLLVLTLPFTGCSNSEVGSIAITPASQTLAAGQTAQFLATGIIGHGKHPVSTQDVTSQVSWTSNAPTIATISSSGLATAVSAGTATLTASMPGSTSSTATLTVTGIVAKPADQLVSLSVIPGSQTLTGITQTADFIVIGTTGTGATVNLTNQSAIIGSGTVKAAAWSSSTPGVATVNPATGAAQAVSNGTTTITAVVTNLNGTVVTGSALLTINISTLGAGEPLVSLAIVPAAQTLTAVNQTATFVVIGNTSSGATVNLTNVPATIGSATIKPAIWTSSSPAVATINSDTGVTTAAGTGVTAIMAAASNPDGTVVTAVATLSVNVTNTPEPLVSLAIVPSAETLTATNQTAQLIAIGTTGMGATVNLTNVPATIGTATIKAATWTSSNPAVATANRSTGIVTAVSSGVAVITAIAANPDATVVTGTATITVNITATPEPLVSLAIVPGSQTASVVNQTAQFIAVGATPSGTTVNLTNQTATIDGVTITAATWGSSSSAVATINPATGLATAISSGTVAITAVAKNSDGTVVTGTATFTVTTTPEPLVSLAIIPGTQSLTAAGQPAQFIAIGTTASGATVNLTGKPATIGPAAIKAATWNSSTMAVATIDRATGLATSGSSGVTVITAMASNPDGTVVTGTATLTVNIPATPEPLVSLAIVPAAQQSMTINQNPQFIAIGTTSTGATINLTNQAATINGFTIAAASWTSSSPAIATIDPATGVATALSAGSVAIIAIAKNPDGTVVTGTAVYTVAIPSVAEPLISMAIVPASQTLTLLGQKAQLMAIATTGSGTTVNLTNQTVTIDSTTIKRAVWTSSDPGVATVNPGTGVVTAFTAGTTVITAIASNPDLTVVTGISTVTVTAMGGSGGTIASISVIPGSQAVQSPNATAQYLAIGATTTGATADLTQQVAWGSSSADIGTIGTSTGLATAVGQGTATMTALYTPPGNGNTVTGTATFTVVGGTAELYTALTILPDSQSLSLGQTSQFVALAKVGAKGFQQDVTNSPQIKWSSNVPSIASIDRSSGLAKGASVGSAFITAELTNPDGTLVSATAVITVSQTTAPEPLLSLEIIPSALTVGDLQDTGQFLAIGTFSTAPYVKDLTNAPGTTWISSFPDSFPINTNSGGTSSASAGIVTAYGTGTATIIAEATSIDGTIQTATAMFSCPLVLPNPPFTAGSCSTGQAGPLKATLTVYGEGLNTTNWLLTASSATGTPNVIHCGPGWTANGGTGGSVCVGIYPIGTTVILTAPAQLGVEFGGWTFNCIPSDANGKPLPGPVLWTASGPNYCAVSLTSILKGSTNAAVGAIFN